MSLPFRTARIFWLKRTVKWLAVRAAPGTAGFGTLLDGREARAAYVCRGTVCFEPVTDYNELKNPLWHRV